MGGRFRGVQAIIKDMYPKALYTYCVSHSLNLCLSDATKSQDIRNAFGIISECCTFFNSLEKRTTFLKNKIKEVSSKLLSFTYNLSKYLQSKNIDLFNALNQVSDIISVFHSMRENVDLKFNNIYKEAKDVAKVKY